MPIVFHGHLWSSNVTGKIIVEVDPNWAFPDCNSSFNSPMATTWREHPSYCRTTVGIRPLGFLSAVGFCKPHPTTSPHHLPSLFAQHWAYSTSNTLIYSFDVRWLGTALSPTSYILQFCRIWIFIYIIIFSGKFYMKSKLQRCLYINFYQN